MQLVLLQTNKRTQSKATLLTHTTRPIVSFHHFLLLTQNFPLVFILWTTFLIIFLSIQLIKKKRKRQNPYSRTKQNGFSYLFFATYSPYSNRCQHQEQHCYIYIAHAHSQPSSHQNSSSCSICNKHRSGTVHHQMQYQPDLH